MIVAQKTEIKKAVSAALREIFSDHDYGLEVSMAFKRKLEASRRDIRAGRVGDLREYLRTMRK